ncbi:MAG: dihydropteroate synthase, partial [Vicinamibacteria bacterium]
SLTFRAKNERLKLGETTALMGVVNVTPDSFYAGSRRLDPEQALAFALKLVEAGADIVDIGGESTRPGASPVDVEEEIRRVVPVVSRLRPLSRVLISVDTRNAGVAERALDAGADIVNDVSALGDPRMAEVVVRAKAGLVLMHLKGTPATMQVSPSYRDVVAEVKEYLGRAIEKAESSGVSGDSILVDPGIGFGKTLDHNLALLRNLSALSPLSKPILIGTSRKSFLGRILSGRAAHHAGIDDEERLLGTAASVACAVLLGASVVRVHDVREMRQVVAVADAIKNQGIEGKPRAGVPAAFEGAP